MQRLDKLEKVERRQAAKESEEAHAPSGAGQGNADGEGEEGEQQESEEPEPEEEFMEDDDYLMVPSDKMSPSLFLPLGSPLSFPSPSRESTMTTTRSMATWSLMTEMTRRYFNHVAYRCARCVGRNRQATPHAHSRPEQRNGDHVLADRSVQSVPLSRFKWVQASAVPSSVLVTFSLRWHEKQAFTAHSGQERLSG